MQFHHILLAAPPGSEGAAREFFGGLLGLEETPKPANLIARGGVWFRCGQQELHIGIEHDFKPARKAHPAFQVANLDELRERLAGHGVTVWEDEPLPGYRRFYANDPFGNRLEFLTASTGC